MHQKHPHQLLYLWSSLSMLVGILLVVCADRLWDVFHYIMGGALCVIALCSLAIGIADGCYRNDRDRTVLKQTLLLALGVLVLASPHSPLFVCVVWGAYSIVKSAMEFQSIAHSFSLRQFRFLRLGLTVAELVMGILLLLELTDALGHHITFLGGTFLIQGLNYLVLAIRKHAFYMTEFSRDMGLRQADVVEEVLDALIQSDEDMELIQALLDKKKGKNTKEPPEKLS